MWAFGFHVVFEHTTRTFRHVVEEAVFDAFAGTFEGQHEHVGFDRTHEHLNAFVVHRHQVFEGEHVVLNFEHQIRIQLVQAIHDAGFHLGLGVVHDLGSSCHTTKTRRLR